MKLIEGPENTVCTFELEALGAEQPLFLADVDESPLNYQETNYYRKHAKQFDVCSLDFYRQFAATTQNFTIYYLLLAFRYALMATDYTRCENDKHASDAAESYEALTENRPTFANSARVRATRKLRRGRGCEHFCQGFAVKCRCCAKIYVCPYCHDYNEAHSFVFGTQICYGCGFEQDRFLNECLYCKRKHAAECCAKCCIAFAEGRFRHCTACDTCYLTQNERAHSNMCGQATEACPICLEHLEYAKPLLMGDCGHICHEICIKSLDQIECPVCRRTNLTAAERLLYIQDLLRAKEHFAPMLFCRFHCLDCQHEGFALDLPELVCQRCRFVNCTRVEKASKEQYRAYKASFPDFLELRQPQTFETACENIRDVDAQVDFLLRSYAARTKTEVLHLFDEINEVLRVQGYFE